MLAHLWSNPGAGRTTDERFQKVWIDNRDFVVPMLIFLASVADAQHFAHEWDAAHPREP